MKSLPTIEMGLINSAKRIEDFAEIQDAGAIFAHYDMVYAVAKAYIERYSVPAPLDVLRGAAEGWEATEGEFSHWFETWIPARRIYATQRAMSVAVETFAKNPDKAEETIRQLITDVQAVGVFSGPEVHATDALVGARYERFKMRAEHSVKKGFTLFGIPTGFSVIDSTRQGWMPGEFVGFFARPTVGKTWLLVRQGVIAWMAGKKVLLISPEMPPEQISYRLDALLAGHMGLPFSHSRVLAGDASQDANYSSLASKINGNNRWWSVSDIGGRSLNVTDIANLVARYKPDLVLVDGVSLLDDEQNGRQEWERMKHVCYDLKRFATFARTTIIASHQAVNSRRGARSNRDAALGRGDDWVMPSLNDSAFGDAFVQACSTVFTLAPDVDHPGIRWYSIRKTRERDIPFHPRLALGWDVDRGLIVDLGKWGQDTIAIQSELARYGIGLSGASNGVGSARDS